MCSNSRNTSYSWEQLQSIIIIIIIIIIIERILLKCR